MTIENSAVILAVFNCGFCSYKNKERQNMHFNKSSGITQGADIQLTVYQNTIMTF